MRELVDLWGDLRTSSRTHRYVRGGVLAGAALWVLAYIAAGGGNPWAWGGGIFIGVLAVIQPHTIAPGLFLGFGVASWWATVDGPWHWALLPAALGLVLLHTCAALCASVPAQAPIPESVLRRWLARLGLVSAVTVLVWGVAGALSTRTGGEGAEALGAWPGIAGLAVLATGLVVYLRWRTNPT
ncbi:hypothetical protein [Ornithinimicrobium sp. Y1694]|uniref:hypothetical protein n=1 Tax=Ornithinimicrobium sp. Y1694 TaxID=3418590 RepID=UPI003CEDE163